MRIELQNGIALQSGAFNAVIAPERVIISALNSHADLQRFLFLFVCGNYSRLLSSINRTSANFEVRRAFTAHQLFTIVKEASHTIVFVEHDPTMFDGAERMITPVSAALRDVGREALVILYTPSVDRPFSALVRSADRIFQIMPAGDPSCRQHRNARSCPPGGPLPPVQTTLEVS
jgi:DNA polymerase I